MRAKDVDKKKPGCISNSKLIFCFITNNSRIWHTVVQQICVFSGEYRYWNKLKYISGLHTSPEELWRTALYNLPAILRHAHPRACTEPDTRSHNSPFNGLFCWTLLLPTADWAGGLCSLRWPGVHQERAKGKEQWCGESIQVHVLSTVNSQETAPLFHFLGHVGIGGISDEQRP